MRKLMLLVTCFVVVTTASVLRAETNILFILDASNSMWGQIDSTAKIDTAKSVLNDALSDLGDGIIPGLMVYGHREKGSCTDVELVVPFGNSSNETVKSAINTIIPHGKTPIAESLSQSWAAFSGREEDNNVILLISDGIETCEGDPCAVAEMLVQRGINLKVNVVGFDVDDATRAQLQCIATKGDGKYFDAKTAIDFNEAIELAQKAVVPEPRQEPEPTGQSVYFEDQFDGDDLSADWELSNPDPDNYLVENGILTLVSHDGTVPDYASSENILRLNKPIPKGDWAISMRFILKPQTMGEMVRLGVAKDAATSLLASAEWVSHNYARTTINIRADKTTGGEITNFTRDVLSIESRDIEVRSQNFDQLVSAIQLRLVKSGRNYEAAIRFEAVNDDAVTEEWLTVQELTSLRPPGDAFTLFFASNSNSYTASGGEGILEIDWVKIETPN